MRIGGLADLTGVSPRSLRYYEERGLLTSERTAGAQRVYAADAVSRVQLIQHLFAAGLSSADVVELLPCVYTGTTTPSMLLRLRAERERVEQQVRQLAAIRDRLDEVIKEAGRRLVTA